MKEVSSCQPPSEDKSTFYLIELQPSFRRFLINKKVKGYDQKLSLQFNVQDFTINDWLEGCHPTESF